MEETVSLKSGAARKSESVECWEAIPLKRRLYPRIKADMTIAVGFQCLDGVLLCADSQYTAADKQYREKISRRVVHDLCITFAMCGDEDYALSAIEDCSEALAALEATKTDLPTVRRAIRDCVSVMSAEYDKHSLPPDQKPAFLVAIQKLTGDVRLFSARDSAIPPVVSSTALGTGGYLARYLDRAFGPRFTQATIEQSLLIALYVLMAAKRHDSYCGGGSQFVALRPGSSTKIYNLGWDQSDDRMVEIERIWGNLFMGIADPIGRNVDIRIEEFTKAMKAAREKLLAPGSPYAALVQSMRP